MFPDRINGDVGDSIIWDLNEMNVEREGSINPELWWKNKEGSLLDIFVLGPIHKSDSDRRLMLETLDTIMTMLYYAIQKIPFAR